jgi:hypothetical protein
VVAGTLLPGTADVFQTTAYYPFGLAMAQTACNAPLPNIYWPSIKLVNNS